MSTVRYREATLADVPALLALPATADAAPDPRIGKYLAGTHHPQQALRPRTIWIATSAEDPIGYIAGHLTRRLDCQGELQWIYVIPEHRRTGIATALVRLLVHWFIRHDARRICVDVGNEGARSFYARLGAVPFDRHWMIWDDMGIVLDRPSELNPDGSAGWPNQ